MGSTVETDVLQRFYSDLEELNKRFDELTDTDVREAIYFALNHFFIWGNANCNWPNTFGMFSAQGDRCVWNALKSFLTSQAIVDFQKRTPVGIERLQFLQDPLSTTAEGRRYDEFIGHVGEPLPDEGLPAFMLEAGEYDYD